MKYTVYIVKGSLVANFRYTNFWAARVRVVLVVVVLVVVVVVVVVVARSIPTVPTKSKDP